MCVSAGQACFGGLSLVLSATLVGVGGGGASASVRASGPSNVSTTFVHQQLQLHEAVQVSGRGRKGEGGSDPARHGQLDPLRRVRPAGHHEGAPDCRTELVAVRGAERTGQRHHPADRRADRHLERCHGAAGRPAGLRRGHADRELRQVPWRQGDRLRPPHPRRQPRLLRQLQQREGRPGHGPGPRQLCRRLAHQRSRRSSSCTAR